MLHKRTNRAEKGTGGGREKSLDMARDFPQERKLMVMICG